MQAVRSDACCPVCVSFALCSRCDQVFVSTSQSDLHSRATLWSVRAMASALVVYEDDSTAITYGPTVTAACAQAANGFCADGWTARTGLADFSDSTVHVGELTRPR